MKCNYSSKFLGLIIVIALTVTAKPGYSRIITSGKDSIFNTDAVLKIMKRAGDWQLETWKTNGIKYSKTDWANAAGYTGLFDLGKISNDEKYHKTLIAIAEDVKWNTGRRRLFADDYCIGQTFSLLYSKYKDEKMIAPFKHLGDSIVSLPFNESLEWKNSIHYREWAWCDALFMGPPALAYLSTAIGDLKYLDKATKLWWKTYDYLYDKEAHLYSRDGSWLDKKEKNGAKVFWSRGNGWVLAGLARVIENMPADYPERKRFVKHFQELSAKIASLQQPDGSWHSSLLDPDSYPIKETSGTGFYCYAMFWGLNNGILKKSKYLPVAKRSWIALSTAVQPDGMLGYVQPIGGSPDKVTEKSNDAYGTGAFLLAGAQLYQYITKKHGKI